MKITTQARSLRHLLLAAALLGATAPSAQAENPPGCTESALYATIAVTPLIAHVGDVLTFNMSVGNAGEPDVCDQLDVNPQFFCPKTYGGTTCTLDFGNLGLFEPGDAVPLAPQTYIVDANDLVVENGKTVAKAEIHVYGLVNGAVPTPTESSQTISAVIVQPDITISKTCRLATGEGGLVGEATVTITNTGDVDLKDIVVADDAGTPGAPGDDFILPFATTLVQGASAVQTYTFPLSGTVHVNTVTVTGRDIIPTSPGNEAAAEVEATDDCKLEIPRDCPTRTIGYWFQHVIATRDDVKCATLTAAFEHILSPDPAGKIGDNRIDLGFIELPTGDRNGNGYLDVEDAVTEALGFFHGKRSVAGDGSRDASCLARKRLALQLIGATANVLFLNQRGDGCLMTDEETGESYTGQELLAAARQAAAECDVAAMSHFQHLLDEFNNSGDELPFEDYMNDGDHSNDLRPCPVGRTNKTYIGAHTYDPTTAENCGCTD